MRAIALHAHKIRQAEAEACTDPNVKMFLLTMPFINEPSVRLLLALVADDLLRGDFTRSIELARALVLQAPDEKPPEDMHQRVRDFQRTRRFKQVSRAAIFGQCVSSKILEARKFEGVKVNMKHIAEMSFEQRKETSSRFKADTASWPSEFNNIMKPHKAFPAFTVAQFFNATMSFGIVENWDQQSTETLWKSWWSRLLKPFHLYTQNDTDWYVPVTVASYAAMVVFLDLEPGTGILRLRDSGECPVQAHVYNDESADAIPSFPVWTDSGLALQKREDGTSRNILQAALLDRREFSAWELRAILYHAYSNDMSWFEKKTPVKDMLQEVIELAFLKELQTRKEVIELYSKPAPDVEEDDILADEPDLQDIVEELMVMDSANSVDLKKFKDVCTAKQHKRLQKRRREHREAAAASRKAKNAARQRRQKLKKNILPPRRKPRPSGPDAVPPASGGAPAPGSRPAALPAAPAPSGPQLPPPPQPPEGRRLRGAPRAGGDWQAMATVGGYLKWSEVEGRCDGHCRWHEGPNGEECKIDRKVKFGSVILVATWLEEGMAPHMDYNYHQIVKEQISSEDWLLQRQEKRRQLQNSTDPGIVRLLDCEADTRGGNRGEPAWLRCQSALAVAKRFKRS